MWPRRATLSTDRSTLISVLTPSSPHKDHVPGGRDLVLRQQSPFSPLPTRERALCRCAFHSVSEILPPQGIYHALSLNAKSPPHGGGCWVLGACPGPGGGRPSPLCPGRHSKQPCTVCQKTGSWQVSRVAAPPPPPRRSSATPACRGPAASCGPRAVISDRLSRARTCFDPKAPSGTKQGLSRVTDSEAEWKPERSRTAPTHPELRGRCGPVAGPQGTEPPSSVSKQRETPQ